MGCPVLRKLQGCIARSTMVAEYTALSITLRWAITFLEVCNYVVSHHVLVVAVIVVVIIIDITTFSL